MHKCASYSLDKINLSPFYHLTYKCDPDLQPIWPNVSNGTSTPQGQQLCHIFLQSTHKCTSYSLDKSEQMRTCTMHACMHIQRTETVPMSCSLQASWTEMFHPSCIILRIPRLLI